MARDILKDSPQGFRMIGYPVFIHYIKYLYQLLGTDPFYFYCHQLLLSLGATLMLSMTGAMVFDRLTGMITGLLFSLYKMNYLYDVLLTKTTLAQFLIILSIFSFCSYQKSVSRVWYMVYLCSGISLCLFRIFFWLPFIAGIIFCVIKDRHLQKKSYLMINMGMGIAALTGFLYFHGPDSYRQKIGAHFYIGSQASGSGLFTPPPGVKRNSHGLALDMTRLAFERAGPKVDPNTHWIMATIDSYRDRPGKILVMLGKKLRYLSNAYEPHNIASVYFFENKTILKKMPRIGYGLIFSLAIIGILLSLIKRHPGAFFLLPLITVLAMILSVFICSRYRMPLIPFLCLFAGYGASLIIDLARSGRCVRLTGVLISFALVLWLSSYRIPVFDRERDIRFWEIREKQRATIFSEKERVRAALPEWDGFSPAQKAELVLLMGRIGMYHEFFEFFDKAYRPAENNGLSKATTLLKGQYASVLENTFQLKRSCDEWEKLTDIPIIRSLALKKIEMLRTVGPVFDPEFQTEKIQGGSSP